MTAQEAYHTLVDTGIGSMACHRRNYPVGADLVLCIRPEFIVLDPPDRSEGRGAFNLAEGVIRTMTFVGDIYEAEVAAGSEMLALRLPPDTGLGVGDTVRFGISAEHCRLVEG